MAPTPGVGLIQAVKRRHRGRMVRVEVRPVLGEAVMAPIRCMRNDGTACCAIA